MGPGSEKYLLPISREIIEKSNILIGAKRYLEIYCKENQKGVYLESPYENIIEYITEERRDKEISLMVSGDSSFYSFTSFIKKHFDIEGLNIVPGISSLQYLYAKIGLNYEHSLLTSLHGRQENLWENAKRYKTLGILTDKEWSPSRIAKEIYNRKLPFKYIYVGENLSYEEELVTRMTIEEGIYYKTEKINGVIVANE
jgi:cobalt-precorrin-7 (C5)-methyltransferase